MPNCRTARIPGLPRLSKPYLQDELAAQIAKVISGSPTNVIPLDRSARRAMTARASQDVGALARLAA